MHTLETLMDLADNYATITADPATLTKARAVLQSALSEILAERDTALRGKELALQYQADAEAERDALQQAIDKCVEAATDAIAFNGGGVQMEAHVRQAMKGQTHD